MRVALVHWTALPTVGGVESHLNGLARHLSKRVGSVTLISGEPEPTRFDGCRMVTTAALRSSRSQNGIGLALSERRDLCDALDRAGADVVHCHNLHYFASGRLSAVNRWAARSRVPVLHTVHAVPSHRSDLDGLNDERVAEVLVVSRSLRARLPRQLAATARLSPLGIDPEEFRPRQPMRVGDQLVLCCPSRLVPAKGAHVAVRALRVVRDAGIPAQLLLAAPSRTGDSTLRLRRYRAFIAQLVRKLRLGPYVSFTSVPPARMPEFYDRSDIVLCPALAPEPLGLVALEAMSMRRPVIASARGGWTETVVDRKSGFLVAPGDHGALAAGVATLWRSPEQAAMFGDYGRERVSERFSLDACAQRAVLAYESCCDARPR